MSRKKRRKMVLTRKASRNRDKRQEEALKRKEISNSLSPAEKLVRLDMKLGVNQGAKRERERLKRLISYKKLETQKPT